jgi:DNA-binding MarR family transcriptional regulator
VAPEGPTRRYSGLLFRVFVISRLTARLLENEVRVVPSDQLGVFSAIASWQPITPTELSRRSGIKPTTLSNVIRRMVDLGLISKTTNPVDSRSYLISLTARGRALWRKAGPALGNAIAMAEDALGDDLDTVIASLEELETTLRELVGDASATLAASA